jgi:hypothetical protein
METAVKEAFFALPNPGISKDIRIAMIAMITNNSTKLN